MPSITRQLGTPMKALAVVAPHAVVSGTRSVQTTRSGKEPAPRQFQLCLGAVGCAALVAGGSAQAAQRPRATCRSRRLLRQQRRAAPPDATQKFEELVAALELAEKAGRDESAAALREEIGQLEAMHPVAAIAWRQHKQVRDALDSALFGLSDNVDVKLEAVQVLGRLATPPSAAPGSEEALHRVLREVSGENANIIREAAEDTLWKSWSACGDEDMDEQFNAAVALLERDDAQGAVDALSKVVEARPDFAEAWNKRATAYYMLKEMRRSIDDCQRVLELKPKHFGCLSGLGMIYMSRGDPKKASKWYKEALSVHPHMEGPRRVLDSIDRNKNVEKHLQPLLDQAVFTLKQGLPAAWPKAKDQGLLATWDVHQVPRMGDDTPLVYLFRVEVRNRELATRPVRSLARFYAMQFSGGKVFPLMRATEGVAQFTLEPGESYRYAWAFSVGQELVSMLCGMLFEHLEEVTSPDRQRFLSLMLDELRPSDAAEISPTQVEKLLDGYYFMGHLDLSQVTDV
mmetsp:Transcript_91138/g.175461  ORF Transcript_91138/g.175461 Transcript_91138/m.175461 type:complete len:515 (+) Transcript_91138:16-1560(+)